MDVLTTDVLKTDAPRLALLFKRSPPKYLHDAPLAAVILLPLYLVSLLAPAQAQPADIFKLTGGITHSEKLEPMPEHERIGSSASQNAAAAASSVPPASINYPPVNSRANTQASSHANSHANTGLHSTGSAGSVRTPALPQLNPIYATPHIDPWQGQYKNRLRQLAQQNVHATSGGARRNQKVQIKVPLWLAGQWQRTETNEISRKDLPTGKALKPVGKQVAIVTDNFGLFKDRRGNVFMIVPLGAVGAIDRGFAVDYHQVKKYDLVLLGKNSALVKVQATHRVVDKKEQKVIAAYQDEELTTYTLVRDGLVKNESSVKVFDQMGQPKLLTRAVSVERRVKRI